MKSNYDVVGETCESLYVVPVLGFGITRMLDTNAVFGFINLTNSFLAITDGGPFEIKPKMCSADFLSKLSYRKIKESVLMFHNQTVVREINVESGEHKSVVKDKVFEDIVATLFATSTLNPDAVLFSGKLMGGISLDKMLEYAGEQKDVVARMHKELFSYVEILSRAPRDVCDLMENIFVTKWQTVDALTRSGEALKDNPKPWARNIGAAALLKADCLRAMRKKN